MKNILGRFFGPSAPPDIEKLKQAGDVQGLVKALNYKDSPDIRRQAALALQEIRDSNAVSKATVSLISDLVSQSESVRKKASEALSEIRNARVADLLIPLLNEKGQKEFVITKAVELLGEMKDSRAVEALLQILAVWNGNLRFGMAESLWLPLVTKMVSEIASSGPTQGLASGENHKRSLIDKLNSAKNVEKAAINALDRIRDDRAIEPLITALDKEMVGYVFVSPLIGPITSGIPSNLLSSIRRMESEIGSVIQFAPSPGIL